MPNQTIKLPTPDWIANAICGYPSELAADRVFMQAAADRVWETMVTLAKLRQRDEGGPLMLRLDVEAYGDECDDQSSGGTT